MEGVCRCWMCGCDEAQRSNESLRGVCQIEVLEHVNSGSLEVWDIKFGKGSLWSPEATISWRKLAFWTKHCAERDRKHDCKGNIRWGKKAEKQRQTNKSQNVHLSNLFSPASGIKILFFTGMLPVGRDNSTLFQSKSTHLENVLGSSGVNLTNSLFSTSSESSNLNYSGRKCNYHSPSGGILVQWFLKY